MKPRHWLDLLVGLRERRAHQKKSELDRAQRHLAEVEAVAIEAERERSTSEAVQHAERQHEAERLQTGAARAVDLMHAARHQRRSDHRLDDLRQHERNARADVAQAEQSSDEVREQLGTLRIDAEVARRAESRQRLDLEARLRKREDDTNEEAWTAGFVARRNG